MKQRGRKSASSLAVVAELLDRRPPPPEALPEAAREVWRAVVGCRPPDWFRPDTHALLAAFCRSVWHAAQLDALIERRFRDDGDRAELPGLLAARDREVKAMVLLARSMRITQHANYAPRTAARKATAGRKPWEIP